MLTPFRKAVLSALFLAPAAGCGGSGSGGGSNGGARVTPAETLEASSPVTVSTIDSLLQLPADTGAFASLDSPLILGRSAFRSARRPALGLAAALRDEGGARALAARIICDEGGVVDASCVPKGGVSRVRASFSRCAFEVPGVGRAEIDGGFAALVDDPLYCSGGATDARTGVEARFTDFVATVEEPGGATRRLEMDLLQVAAPSGEGCATDEEEELIDGDLIVDGRITIETEEPLRDLVIRVDGLRYELVSAGDPCVVTLTVNGRAQVEDRIRNRKFTQEYEDLVLTLEENLDGGGCVTIDGAVTNACLGGRVVYRTLEPICFEDGADCPTAGLLEVTPAGAPAGRLRFTPAGGVEIDVEGDGVVDKALTDCREADRSLCTGGS